MSPHPQAIDAYRKRTHAEAGWNNLKTKTCTRCKRTRSGIQFIDNPDVCRTCRKGK